MIRLLPLLFLPTLALAGGLDDLDGIDGWAERPWGSAPTAELVAVGNDDVLVYYALPKDDARFGELPVSELVLGYASDQLVAFRFEVAKGLGKEMKNLYGKASRTGVGEKFWIGDRVKLTVTGPSATFTYTEKLGTGATLNTAMNRAVADGATAKGSLDYLDTRPGWRDLAWGGPPANGMERVDGDATGESYYIRDTDKLAAGDYPLKSIGYGYYKEQLFSVMLMIPDYAAARGIRSGLVEAYGEPTDDGEGHVAWRGKRVEVTLAFDDERGEGAVIYYYVPVLDQLKADEEAAAHKAADDL